MRSHDGLTAIEVLITGLMLSIALCVCIPGLLKYHNSKIEEKKEILSEKYTTVISQEEICLNGDVEKAKKAMTEEYELRKKKLLKEHEDFLLKELKHDIELEKRELWDQYKKKRSLVWDWKSKVDIEDLDGGNS